MRKNCTQEIDLKNLSHHSVFCILYPFLVVPVLNLSSLQTPLQTGKISIEFTFSFPVSNVFFFFFCVQACDSEELCLIKIMYDAALC